MTEPLQVFNTINKFREILTNTISSVFPSMVSFRAEVQTHVSLLTQLFKSLKEKYSPDMLIEAKRWKLVKTITGSLDVSNGEYYSYSINKLNYC